MRKKVKIDRINRQEKECSKGGKTWTATALGIKVGEYWINGFESDETKGWKEGDEVDIKVKVSKKDDKTYYNFEPVSQEELWRDSVDWKLNSLNERLTEVAEMFKQQGVVNAMQTELGAEPVNDTESKKLRDKIFEVIKTAEKSQYAEIKTKAKKRLDEGALTQGHYDEVVKKLESTK